MKIPTKVAAITAALLLAVTLSACGDDTAAGSGEGASTQSRSQSVESETPDRPVAESPGPLAAESPANDVEALFLAEARDRLTGLGSATTIPNATDEQLIAAGHQACEALIAQQPFNDVSVIEGEQRVQGSFLDSAAIASAGILYFCPEVNGKTL